jgi:hypothetical protein
MTSKAKKSTKTTINWETLVAGISLIVAALTYYSANQQFRENYKLTVQTLEKENFEDSLRQIKEEEKFILTIKQSKEQFEKNLHLTDMEVSLVNKQLNLYRREIEIQKNRLKEEKHKNEMSLKKDKLILDSKIRGWINKISTIYIRLNAEFARLDIGERDILYKEMEDFILNEIGNQSLISNDSLHKEWLGFYFYLLSPVKQGNNMQSIEFAKLEQFFTPKEERYPKNEINNLSPDLSKKYNNISESVRDIKSSSEDFQTMVLSAVLEKFLVLLGKTCDCENLEYVQPDGDTLLFLPLLKK